MPFSTDGLTYGEVSSSGKGAKTVPLLGASSYSPGTLQCLWQPKGFNGEDTNRVSISFKPTEDLVKDVRALESWVLDAVSGDPRKFFNTDLSPQQIQERFGSMLKTSDKGHQSFRAKMNFSGRNGVKCWSADRQRRDLPDDWPSCSVKPLFVFKGLWIMSREWGVLCELTDAQITESDGECPFSE